MLCRWRPTRGGTLANTRSGLGDARRAPSSVQGDDRSLDDMPRGAVGLNVNGGSGQIAASAIFASRRWPSTFGWKLPPSRPGRMLGALNQGLAEHTSWPVNPLGAR